MKNLSLLQFSVLLNKIRPTKILRILQFFFSMHRYLGLLSFIGIVWSLSIGIVNVKLNGSLWNTDYSRSDNTRTTSKVRTCVWQSIKIILVFLHMFHLDTLLIQTCSGHVRKLSIWNHLCHLHHDQSMFVMREFPSETGSRKLGTCGFCVRYVSIDYHYSKQVSDTIHYFLNCLCFLVYH